MTSTPFLEIALAKAIDDPAAAASDLCAWLPDEDERTALAAAILRSVSVESAEAAAEALLIDLREGPPIPPFWRLRAEAEAWVEFASPAQVATFAWVAYHAMPLNQRTAFVARAYSEAEAAA